MQGSYTLAQASAQVFKLDPRDHDTIEFVASEPDRPQDRTIVRGKQINHIRKVFAGRHGKHLPDTESAREQLLALLRVMAAIPRIKTATLIKEVQRWAPWMAKGERSELIDTAKRTPRVHRKESLGKILRLVDTEQNEFKAWSIWPIDLSLAESKLRKKSGKRKRDTERRRAAGAVPRSEYLAKVASKEPWVALNMSRSKYYRLKAKGMIPAPSETGSAPSTISIVIDTGINSVEAYTGRAPRLTPPTSTESEAMPPAWMAASMHAPVLARAAAGAQTQRAGERHAG
jgi:hypothetical protein